MASESDNYPHIRIEGGPEPGDWRIFRDGVPMTGVLEFQINGGLEQPVTAIFKEIVVFDGQISVMPRRRGTLDS